MSMLVMDMAYHDFLAGLQHLFFLALFIIFWGLWLVYHHQVRYLKTRYPKKQGMWTGSLIYSKNTKETAEGEFESSFSSLSSGSLSSLSSLSSFSCDETLSLPDSPPCPSPPLPGTPGEDTAGYLRRLPRPPGAGLKLIRREAMTHHPVKFNIRKKHFEALCGCPTF